MYKKDEAKKLIKETEEIITVSGATILRVEKELEEINRKSQENIEKLALLI